MTCKVCARDGIKSTLQHDIIRTQLPRIRDKPRTYAGDDTGEGEEDDANGRRSRARNVSAADGGRQGMSVRDASGARQSELQSSGELCTDEAKPLTSVVEGAAGRSRAKKKLGQ